MAGPTVNGNNPKTNSESTTSAERRVDVLESTILALKESNELLRKRLEETVEKKWFWPRFMFFIVTTIFTGFFGANLYTQYVNMGGLDVATDNLRTAIDLSKTDMKTVKDEMHEVRTESVKKLDQLRDSIMENEVLAHKLLTMITLGRSYLIEQRAPKVSLGIANRAAAMFENKLNESASDGRKTAVLEQIGPLIYGLKAESAWQSSDIDNLTTAVDGLAQSCGKGTACDFVERTRYEGLLALMRANELSDPARSVERKVQLMVAAESFRSVLADSDGHDWAIVLRGITLLDWGDATSAEDSFSKLVKRYPKEVLDRMPSDVRARVELAVAGEYLAKIAMKSDMSVSPDFQCNIEVGAIGVSEATEVVKCLTSLIKRRTEINPESRQANYFGLFAAKIIASIENASQLGNCGKSECVGCAPSATQSTAWHSLSDSISADIKIRFGLRDQIDLPPLSRDPKLARVDANGKHTMVRVKLITEQRTKTVNENGATIEKTYEVEVPYQEEIEFSDASAITEDRYIAFDQSQFANQSLVAPPAPAETSGN